MKKLFLLLFAVVMFLGVAGTVRAVNTPCTTDANCSVSGSSGTSCRLLSSGNCFCGIPGSGRGACGVSVNDGGLGSNCDNSSPCNPPLICGYSGLCINPPVGGNPCTTNADCVPPFQVCGEGDVCVNNGGLCNTNNDCISPMVCQGATSDQAGNCVNSDGSGAGHYGSPCTTNTQCNSPLTCSPQSNTCTGCSPACSTGQTCVGGVCSNSPTGFNVNLVNPLCPTGAGANCVSHFSGIITAITNFLSWFIVSVATLVIVWAGFLYVTSGGNPGRVAMAQKALIYAVVGIAIALAGSGLVAVITAVVSGP